MRQQFANPAGAMRGQAGEHIAQVGVRVVPVHARRLHQAHHGCCPLARAQAAGKQPVVPANGNGPDLVLDPVVVHGQLPVIDEARQRSPAAQAVIERFGRCRTIGQLLPVQCHPFMQRIEDGLGVLLSDGLALIGAQFLDIALDVVDLGELLQGEPGDLDFVCRMQVKEFAPGVRRAARLQDAIGKSRLIAIPFKVLPLCL